MNNRQLFQDVFIVVPLISNEFNDALIFSNNHSWFTKKQGKILFKIGGKINKEQLNLLKNKNHYIFEKDDFSLYNSWNQAMDFLSLKEINDSSLVIFLGIDDYLNEAYLDNVISSFKTKNNIDFLYGDVKSVLGNYSRVSKSNPRPNIFKKNNFSFDIPHPGLANKWSTIKNYRFNEEYQLAADMDFYIRISKDKIINHEYIPIIQAAIGANGVSNSYKAKSIYLREWKLIAIKNNVDLDLNIIRPRLKNLLTKIPFLFFIFRNIYWRIYGTKMNSNENLKNGFTFSNNN